MIEHLAVVVLAAALIITVLSGSRMVAAERRQAARERDLLINQLLHATGKTWASPPADEPYVPVPPAEPGEHRVRFTAAPEQFPA